MALMFSLSRTSRFLTNQSLAKFASKQMSVENTNQIRYASTSKKHEGKTALVTASTEGIGLAIARKLAQDGARVIISSRRKAKVDAALSALKKEGLDVLGTVCHVGEEKDRKQLVEFASKIGGGIDILVSNAAVNPAIGPILETSEPVFDKVFDINVKAALLLTQLVVPEMEKKNGGAIVFISSIAAYQAFPMLGIYSVSKTALLGLSRILALECASSNIRVNAVCPGIIDTKFSSSLTGNKDIMDAFLANVAIKRAGVPDEIGGLVSFLCSNEASYITGESFPVTGGFFSRI